MLDAIYYPYFQPPASWLRRAALCWNTVYRFRPHDAPPDSEDLVALDSELGGVLDSIRDFSGVDVGDELLDWVDANLSRWRTAPHAAASPGDPLAGLWRSKFPSGGLIDALAERGLAVINHEPTLHEMAEWEVPEWKSRHRETLMEAVDVEHKDPDEPDGILRLSFPFEAPHPGSPQYRHAVLKAKSWNAWRRGDKLTSRQLEAEADALRERHLVNVRDTVSVVMLPEELAEHYLALVAREFAARRGAVPVAARAQYIDVVTHAYRSVHGRVAEGLLNLYLPQDIDDLEPARLREVRDELAHRRRYFHAEIDGLIGQLVPDTPRGDSGEQASDRDRLARNVAAAERDLIALGHEQVQAVQAAYRKARLEAAVVPMGLTLTPPAVFAALGSALGIGLLGPLGVGAAVGVALQAVRLGRGAADAHRASSAWSYVLDVQRGVG